MINKSIQILLIWIVAITGVNSILFPLRVKIILDNEADAVLFETIQVIEGQFYSCEGVIENMAMKIKESEYLNNEQKYELSHVEFCEKLLVETCRTVKNEEKFQVLKVENAMSYLHIIKIHVKTKSGNQTPKADEKAKKVEQKEKRMPHFLAVIFGKNG
ncbi:hypothetical protein DdX_15717 [Ditylenchus destructor]|uniref:Uncharacterized protein n=1 Tax=Ditylenchus destructor TaxID=166010 RepID=A0AAD4MQA8_9BILA|nr:hypothetical protein DdX_15717 [Ditylenchus destructor]